MKKSTAVNQLILISAIIVVILLISTKFYFRLDFTEDKRYTLSAATKEVLADLDNVITVKAYFTKNLPPQLANIREDFESLLIEYEDRANGNLVYEFISPNESEQKEQDAQQKGINPIMVSVQEKDQAKQMRAYLGVTLQMGEKTEVIPFVQPNGGTEYALTTAIKKLAVEDKPKIALISGHGEPSLRALGQLMEQLSVLYDPETYEIPDTAEIPAYYKSLLWIDPKDSIPASHFDKLDNYLLGGGNLFIAYNQLENSLQQPFLNTRPDIGLKNWLGKKGIQLNNAYVIDAQCMPVSIQQNMGNFIMQRQIQFPFIPAISTFEEHPIVDGLETMVLPFTAPISYSRVDSAASYFPLAFSSDMSGVQSAPTSVDIQREWTEKDFTDPNQLVAIALEKNTTSKIVFIANSTFVSNGEGQQQQAVNEDNVNFASNAVDWLSDDTGLIDLRTKGVTNRPLPQLEDTERNLYKWGNALLPIMIILVIAGVRKQRNNRKKQRWIAGNI